VEHWLPNACWKGPKVDMLWSSWSLCYDASLWLCCVTRVENHCIDVAHWEQICRVMLCVLAGGENEDDMSMMVYYLNCDENRWEQKTEQMLSGVTETTIHSSYAVINIDMDLDWTVLCILLHLSLLNVSDLTVCSWLANSFPINVTFSIAWVNSCIIVSPW